MEKCLPSQQPLLRKLERGKLTHADFCRWIDDIIRPVEPSFDLEGILDPGSKEIVRPDQAIAIGRRLQDQVYVPNGIVAFPAENEHGANAGKIVEERTATTHAGKKVPLRFAKTLLGSFGDGMAGDRDIVYAVEMRETIKKELIPFCQAQWKNTKVALKSITALPMDFHAQSLWVMMHFLGKTGKEKGWQRYLQFVLAEELSHVDAHDFVARFSGRRWNEGMPGEWSRIADTLMKPDSPMKRVFDEIKDKDPGQKEKYGSAFFEIEARLQAMTYSPSPAATFIELLADVVSGAPSVEASRMANEMLVSNLDTYLAGKEFETTEEWIQFLSSALVDIDAFNIRLKEAAGKFYAENFLTAAERQKLLERKPEAPASLLSLKKDFALRGAPKIEEGVFTAAPFAVLSTLAAMGTISFWGFLFGMGISYTVFLGAHIVNYFRAPPAVRTKGFSARLRWAFKAPLKVAIRNFFICAALGGAMLFAVPTGGELAVVLPFSLIFITGAYFFNAILHGLTNLRAFLERDHAPAAIKAKETKKINDEIRKAYEELSPGETREIAGDLDKMISGKWGYLQRSFPSPEGGTIGKSPQIGCGENIAITKLVIRKTEQGKFQLEMGYTKNGRDGTAHMIWENGSFRKYNPLREEALAILEEEEVDWNFDKARERGLPIEKGQEDAFLEEMGLVEVFAERKLLPELKGERTPGPAHASLGDKYTWYSPFLHAPVLEELGKVGVPFGILAALNWLNAGMPALNTAIFTGVLSIFGIVFMLAHVINRRGPPSWKTDLLTFTAPFVTAAAGAVVSLIFISQPWIAI
ncbi:MAG: hypothetical protein WBB84_03930, partial [Candidatus Omnitrophota bacterium]